MIRPAVPTDPATDQPATPGDVTTAWRAAGVQPDTDQPAPRYWGTALALAAPLAAAVAAVTWSLLEIADRMAT